MFSRRDDVTLANPIAPPVRGWDQIQKTLDRLAPLFREGEPIRFERVSEYATEDLAYIVEFERNRLKLSGSDEIGASFPSGDDLLPT